jgi:uncharacterized protein (DUF433 family)
MAKAEENTDALIEQYIEPDPRRPRIDDARVKDYGIAVWAIIGRLEAAHGDIAQAAADYDLPPDAVRAALAYYARYRDAIDARRAANRVDVA